MTDQPPTNTAVLYNANCPVCSYEIDHYAAYSEAQDLPIAFHDLNEAALLKDWNLTEDMAARRLHVLKKGTLLAGIPAFIVLWQDMPRYRWLARLVSLPGVYRLSCWSYDYVLAPLIYRWHLRRKARQRMPS
jgi:predicted DCC family thiol-disulfide oxidoreductase YuxK